MGYRKRNPERFRKYQSDYKRRVRETRDFKSLLDFLVGKTRELEFTPRPKSEQTRENKLVAALGKAMANEFLKNIGMTHIKA